MMLMWCCRDDPDMDGQPALMRQPLSVSKTQIGQIFCPRNCDQNIFAGVGPP